MIVSFPLAYLASLFLFSGAVLLVVCSGMGCAYFNKDFILWNASINMRIMFACGCAVFILVLALMIFSAIIPELWHVVPVILVIHTVLGSLYITYTRPSVSEQYLRVYDEKWTASGVRERRFQFKYQCCGWHNATDRGLASCPYDFAAGCSEVAYNYLEPRRRDLFIWSIVGFVLVWVSWLVNLIVSCMCFDTRDNLLTGCFSL